MLREKWKKGFFFSFLFYKNQGIKQLGKNKNANLEKYLKKKQTQIEKTPEM